MGNKNKVKFVTIQITRGFREGGRTLQVGDRIEVHPKRAKTMERCGYAIPVDPEAPYTHPAAKKEHQFREIDFEVGETLAGEPQKTEVTKAVVHEPGALIEVPAKPVEPEPNIKIGITPLEDMDFLNKGHLKALKKSNIKTLNDVAGWDLGSLTLINGVSGKTSQKLLDVYNQMCNLDHNKDSDMEVQTK